MSKHNADKESGLPPKTTTRFQLPDARISRPDMTQADRKGAMYDKAKNDKVFGRVGIIGPN